MINSNLVLKVLKEHATQREDDAKWEFDDYPGHTYDDDSALGIVRSCLFLDVPVSITLTGDAWGKLCDKVARLEDRLNQLSP